MVSPSQTPSQSQLPAAVTPQSPATPSVTSSQAPGAVAGTAATPPAAPVQQSGANVGGLDPAHRGKDPGGRGTGGIRGGGNVVRFAMEGRRALGEQRF